MGSACTVNAGHAVPGNATDAAADGPRDVDAAPDQGAAPEAGAPLIDAHVGTGTTGVGADAGVDVIRVTTQGMCAAGEVHHGSRGCIPSSELVGCVDGMVANNRGTLVKASLASMRSAQFYLNQVSEGRHLLCTGPLPDGEWTCGEWFLQTCDNVSDPSTCTKPGYELSPAPSLVSVCP